MITKALPFNNLLRVKLRPSPYKVGVTWSILSGQCFMKLTPTPKNDQASDAWTQADSAALATALRLYSLHEQVAKVERASVGWTGRECKTIEMSIA